jgi:hypothetical protein
MRRPAAILILLLLTNCRYDNLGRRVAAAAVIHSLLRIQVHAPLTQSATRPAAEAPGRARRLIAPPAPRPQDRLVCTRTQQIIVVNSL